MGGSTRSSTANSSRARLSRGDRDHRSSQLGKIKLRLKASWQRARFFSLRRPSRGDPNGQEYDGLVPIVQGAGHWPFAPDSCQSSVYQSRQYGQRAYGRFEAPASLCLHNGNRRQESELYGKPTQHVTRLRVESHLAPADSRLDEEGARPAGWPICPTDRCSAIPIPRPTVSRQHHREDGGVRLGFSDGGVSPLLAMAWYKAGPCFALRRSETMSGFLSFRATQASALS